MAQTVIGFFDSAAEAQTALQRLENGGISRSRVDISTGSATTGSAAYEGGSRDDDQRESGIARFFRNLFGDDDDEATRYSQVASRSGSIVTVHAQSEDEAERAADILDECGAVDVDERAAQYGYGSTRSTTGITGERDATIERVEENLEVGKRTVEKGGVRVRSRIVERPVEEHVRLREENVYIERNPVNRPVEGDALSSFQEREIELTERAEVPVVSKEARVVEEVRVGKQVTERDETIRDTVRNTEIDIDSTGRNDTTRNGGTGRTSFED